MRKLLSTVAAITFAGGVAWAANVPLLSGPVDMGALPGVLNALIQSINSNTTGNFSYVPGPVGNAGSGTTTQNITFASATIPTGQLVAAGQGYRARCAGTSGAATTIKVGITIGRSMAASMEVGSILAPNWDLDLQFQAATNPVTANYTWMARAFAGPAAGTASTNAVTVNSGNDTTVTDNNVNFGLPVTCVMYGGNTTGTVTMMNFAIEQLR